MKTGVPANDAEPIRSLDWTTKQQGIASDPVRSVWVAANAGSGKTHVLSQRVIRLLLAGCRPSAILCLTYTKAAASEMANRVFDRLAEWTRLDDDSLSSRIAELEGRPPSDAQLVFARQLFARALETPGGLKIQTIHAFCEAVLHRFPLEANVAGHFDVMDEAATARLFTEARRTLLQEVASGSDDALTAAFETVLDVAGDSGLERLMAEILRKRQPIRRFLASADRHGGVDALLRRALRLGPAETAETIRRSVWPLPSLPSVDADAFRAAAREQKGVIPQRWAALLQDTAAADPASRYDFLQAGFLTQDGKPRSLRHAVPKPMTAMLPDAEAWLQQASNHVIALHDRMQRLAMLEHAGAAMVLARRLDRDYEALKRRHGTLDFDDLVARTVALLRRDGAGPWVHYKLDRGIDHILIDEAQDTSPDQWAVIESLSDEFFAGQTARPQTRTLFAVGDEKQSIYSFQGARPELFLQTGRAMGRRAFHAQKHFEAINLHLSFRSTRDVLSAVDTVFASAENRQGLVTQDEAVGHAAFRAREPGCVDLWDMIGKQRTDDHEDWRAPFDATPESAPAAVLARRIAGIVSDWLRQGETVLHKGRRRPLRAGDILVLVRKRDGFVPALMRHLKRAHIPVAGADRLRLTEHIAVEDLMALGRFVLMPGDDLSLSAVLKSPLFECGEDDIYRLAAERGERESVHARLNALADAHEGKWPSIRDRLAALIARADGLPVHDFYARLLGHDGGRAAFLARLGSEAGDVLDAFLSFALEQEMSGLPGLEAFLATLEAQSPEIKRELEQGRDEIRIMTVHAAKGLEAPVVFLVDSGGKPAEAAHLPKLQELPLDETVGALPPAMVWMPAAASGNSTAAALRERLLQSAADEYRRLLYVGMTRAADRLVLCGYHGLNTPSYDHWHKMAGEALGKNAACSARDFTAAGETWSGLRYVVSAPLDDFGAQQDAAMQPAAEPLPPMLRKPLATPTPLPRPLAPSRAGLFVEPDSGYASGRSPLFQGEENSRSMERGRLVHRLLQLLPEIQPADRAVSGQRYVDRAIPAWPADERAELLAAALTILEDDTFAPVFAPGSRAEVSIVGTLEIAGQPRALSARLDRIAVAEDRVLIVDYKTDRTPPKGVGDVRPAHVTQMALYRSLVRPLYPQKPVETALLYTAAPRLIPLADKMLDAAWHSLDPGSNGAVRLTTK